MAVRVKWDKFETALLIETFWLIENDHIHKKDYVQTLSTALRQKAVNSGLEIDKVFRNINGINMQLESIAHTFYPERPGLTTSSMFEEMVYVYKNDKTKFGLILHEAKELIKEVSAMNQNNKHLFSDWLIKRQ